MTANRKQSCGNGRITVFALKEAPAYRDWIDELSRATLITPAIIVRDALAKWAADRGLPRPPSGPGSEAEPRPAARPRKRNA